MNYLKLFIIFALLNSFSFSQQVMAKEINTVEIIKKCLTTGDTTGLRAAILDLSTDFDINTPYVDENLILALKSKVNKFPNKYRAGIYSICRKYYQNTPQAKEYFEYMYLEYTTLTRLNKRKDLIWLLIDIGNIFYSIEEYGQAREFYTKSAEIAKRYKNYDALAVAHMNQGMIYSIRKDLTKSLKEFQLSTVFRLKGLNPKFACISQVNIADTYIKLGKLDEAWNSIKSAQYIFDNMGDKEAYVPDFKNNFYLCLTSYYYKTGEFDKMYSYLDKAERNVDSLKNFGSIASFKYFKSKLLIDLKEYKKAKEELISALDILENKYSVLMEIKIYNRLGIVCSFLHEYKQSSEYYAKSITLNKEYLTSSDKLQLDFFKTVSAIFESENKLEKAEQKINFIELKNSTNKFQRNISMIFVSLLTITILIVSILFYKVRKKEREMVRLNKILNSNHLELNEKKKQLEQTNQIKDKLFSIIAHDLRNPLNRMSVELAIMKRSLENKTITKAIENTLKETINLFERLLQWSKMENKQHIYMPIENNLNETLNKVIAFYYPEIKSRNIEIINNNKSYLVFVDPNFLQTLFRNILSNSISAVGKNGKIRIDLVEISAESIQIIFQDSGKGFSPDVVNYFNDPNASLNEISSGIGLVLCKELSKLSNWEMKISNAGIFGGAYIQLNLPLISEIDVPNENQYIEQFNFNLPEAWKINLSPLKTFKFYQTSEIRFFLKTIEIPLDSDVKKWKDLIEKAIFEGDQAMFNLLIKKLD